MITAGLFFIVSPRGVFLYVNPWSWNRESGLSPDAASVQPALRYRTPHHRGLDRRSHPRKGDGARHPDQGPLGATGRGSDECPPQRSDTGGAFRVSVVGSGKARRSRLQFRLLSLSGPERAGGNRSASSSNIRAKKALSVPACRCKRTLRIPTTSPKRFLTAPV